MTQRIKTGSVTLREKNKMKIKFKNEKTNYLMRIEVLKLKIEVHSNFVLFEKLHNYDNKFCGVDILNLRIYK